MFRYNNILCYHNEIMYTHLKYRLFQLKFLIQLWIQSRDSKHQLESITSHHAKHFQCFYILIEWSRLFGYTFKKMIVWQVVMSFKTPWQCRAYSKQIWIGFWKCKTYHSKSIFLNQFYKFRLPQIKSCVHVMANLVVLMREQFTSFCKNSRKLYALEIW